MAPDVAVSSRRRHPQLASRALVVDASLAILIAAVLLIVSPGLAVVGIVALVVILIVLISFGVEALRRRRRSRSPRSGLRRRYHQ
jgi:ABC-type bacteriocin/lantibiotic exporter with double-glycine peptidase domain